MIIARVISRILRRPASLGTTATPAADFNLLPSRTTNPFFSDPVRSFHSYHGEYYPIHPRPKRDPNKPESTSALNFGPRLTLHNRIQSLIRAGDLDNASVEARQSVFFTVSMGPRWKGKGSEAKALANPMSKTISDLQSSLIKSNSQGILSDSSVLLPTNPDQTDLLNQSCFGRPIITVDKDKQWFQLTLEEAFYLSFSLNCIKIVTGNNIIKTNTELWDYMISKRVSFPDFFKAYSYLRAKNWVVRSGCQYGVDFVAYRHHPSLVHSEYGVLVFSEGDRNQNGNGNGNGDWNGNDRLRVWSDFQCTLRLSGSVAKTLLILYVNRNGESGVDSPFCLGNYSVEERTITRWNPERCREDQSGVEIRTK